MSVTLLEQPPPTLPGTLGPYRRADYAVLPDEPRCELIHGRFYLSPSPIPLHQFLVTRIGRLLDDIAERTGGLTLVAPMDVHLADHSVLQPDILYISKQNLGIIHTWIEGPPDLVVEILSRSTASRDQVHKLQIYGESGVPEYWIVDPRRRHITFLVLRDGAYAVQAPEAGRWISPVRPEIELDIEVLWATVEEKFGLPDPPGGRKP